jgi:hypothetical protein
MYLRAEHLRGHCITFRGIHPSTDYNDAQRCGEAKTDQRTIKEIYHGLASSGASRRGLQWVPWRHDRIPHGQLVGLTYNTRRVLIECAGSIPARPRAKLWIQKEGLSDETKNRGMILWIHKCYMRQEMIGSSTGLQQDIIKVVPLCVHSPGPLPSHVTRDITQYVSHTLKMKGDF